MIALALIMLIMVTQFNSFAKPFIIMLTVLFSTIGVFGGLATFRMDFVIIMTGIGIISLAGVVVNNGIVLIDYIDFLKLRAKNGWEWARKIIYPSKNRSNASSREGGPVCGLCC